MHEARSLARLVWNSPARLARMAGFELLQDGLHDEWIRRMAFGDGDETLQAHRGSYKTTCLEVALWLICITQPSKTCGFIRKASDDVEEVMASVARLLATDVSQMMCEIIHGRDVRVTEDTSSSVSTDLACNAASIPQVSGFGIGSSLTGKHFDYVFTDDIVTVRDRVSRAERERTKSTYMELQNVKNRGGRLINTGTPWHKEDAFKLMPGPDRWTWRDTGLISDEEIADLRKSMTPSLFAANYELRHIANEGAIFQTGPEPFADASMLFDGIMHVDAAYGGEDGTAITCIRWDGDSPCVAGFLWPETHVDTVLDRIRSIHERFRLGTVFMERNADKGYLAEVMRSMGLPVETYQEHQNKFIKISTHARGSWANLKRFDDSSGPSSDYWAQVFDYTEGAQHDDAPDSLACAIRLHNNRTRVHLFKGGI